MNNLKTIICISLLILFLPLSLAVTIGNGNNNYPAVVILPPINPVNYSVINVNNSQYWQGYSPSTLPHNILFDLQGGAGNEYYHLDLQQWQDLVYLYNQTQGAINIISGNYVPYTGANQNVNLNTKNISAGSFILPTGGQLNFRNDTLSNDSYIYYNNNTRRVELWVNGKLQQDWGNSTTIYGVATFESNAFFKNLSGTELIIDANVLVNGTLDAASVYGGNLCYSNGTNCYGINITNITLNYYNTTESDARFRQITVLINASEVNKTTGLYFMNQTADEIFDMTYTLLNLSYGLIGILSNQVSSLNASKLDITDQRYNDTAYANALFQNVTSKSGEQPYLFNDTTKIYLNETMLNNTIKNISAINAYVIYTNVTVTGGSGVAVSNSINYLLTRVTVYPPSNSTPYNFEAISDTTSTMIDKDRMIHYGVWDIKKQIGLSSEGVGFNISNAGLDGVYSVKLTFVNNYLP